MDAKNGAKAGAYFVWNVFVLIISLILWRIVFSLIALVLIIGLAIPFGVTYGASTAVGLPNSAALVTSLIFGLGLTGSIGSVAARYGYECPQLDVSFTRPE